MSTTVTSTPGVFTRQRVKSSSQQLKTMEEMVGTMEQLASRKRGVAKAFPSETPGEEQTPDSKV